MNKNDNINLNFMSLVSIKPEFAMAGWRHLKTQDGRLATFVVLRTGALEQESGIMAELETSERLVVTVSGPSALFDAEKIMKAICSFCTGPNDSQRRYSYNGYAISSTSSNPDKAKMFGQKCIITLPPQSSLIFLKRS